MNPRALQRIALEVAAESSLDPVLEEVVRGLSREPDLALARIWLIRPGDECGSCPLRQECPGEVDCLHLVASSGQSIASPGITWDSLTGSFRRFPIGVRKVGRIAEGGEAQLLRIGRDPGDWVVAPDWMEAEAIRSFAGQPLIFRGEVLGVLAVFSRAEIDQETFGWLRTFADQAAVAIANARTVEELERLREQVELERDYLREEVRVARTFMGMVGESAALKQIERQVELVAPTEASVLIYGETGTGKELIANAIHERSPRADRALVTVNCASIPRELFESEFFGHARGAFTGALRERAGRFQVASSGTLFFDEIGEIPLELQGKLLRALQEGQYSRVGEDGVRTADVRVIAATHRDLRREIERGRFREDLFYRLSVFPISVPPLRDRREDIPLLAEHFLRRISSERGMGGITLRRRDVRSLQSYDWPGNVRELRNVIERAVILSSAGRLQIDLDSAPGREVPRATAEDGPREILTDAEMRQEFRRNILAALEAAGGKVSGEGGAAELLGMKPTTLASRLKALGIRRHG